MPTEVTMPELGESVVEGTVGKWLKQPGDHVEQYEPLLEIVTDKVDTEVPAPATGVVREIIASEGATVRVGDLLAVLETGDGAADGQAADQHAEAAAPPHAEAQTAETQASGRAHRAGGPPVSPVVARMVAEHNLDLDAIEGTGLNGRVTKQDVLRYLDRRPETDDRRADDEGRKTKDEETVSDRVSPVAAPPSSVSERPSSVSPPPPSAFTEEVEIVPLTPMRRSIAEHMVRSRQISPHVTSVFEVDLSRVIAHRERHKAEYERQGAKLTFTPYFVQAAVAALQAVPSVNASYSDEGIVQHRRIHVGVAVALAEGLIVPVLRNADEKNLLGLARSVSDLSERARSRRLKPDETHGGTFTITNHGVGGSLFAMPIINQPQAAILGVGAIQKRPVVISHGGVDAIAIRPMCYLSLTIDHRLLDGAVADQFLSVVKRFLEEYR